MTRLIDTAQRLRIVRQAEQEFLRNWAVEKPEVARRFQSGDQIVISGSLLQSRRFFDDE